MVIKKEKNEVSSSSVFKKYIVHVCANERQLKTSFTLHNKKYIFFPIHSSTLYVSQSTIKINKYKLH